ncbi:hypothetical protein N7481_006158 [Penicillium waksmanii]|uniref:uncharacterized protein n=1 Tax=Penicillium waksmanii TaxID=69791 RepID=UPI0025492E5C|nr:uncharacterized protein N7481_006158 [Penicillium waksmanii]KAJ5984059.1 hypothetical protein N7481_006158 [Penicillium waksmanii]
MPICTLHLLALKESTDAQSYVQELQKSTKVILASRPRHIVIHPTNLDTTPLATEPWDLLLLLQPKANTTENPIPTSLRTAIKSEYKIPTGIPSKLLTSYTTRNKVLQEKSSSIPLTGSLEKLLASGSKSSSQNLEISSSLISFMDELSQTHPGPVTMLNLLHFQQPGGKKSYYQYGQAFVPVAGKRGGDAKLVGNVVTPQHGSKDPSSSSRAAVAEEWWNEISLVHYPSIRHFCDMLAGDDYQAINEKYRLSALRDTFLLCTTELNLDGQGLEMKESTEASTN